VQCAVQLSSVLCNASRRLLLDSWKDWPARRATITRSLRQSTGAQVVVQRDRAAAAAASTKRGQKTVAYHRVAHSFPEACERLFPGRVEAVSDQGSRSTANDNESTIRLGYTAWTCIQEEMRHLGTWRGGANTARVQAAWACGGWCRGSFCGGVPLALQMLRAMTNGKTM
jgi:hypothetical protein